MIRRNSRYAACAGFLVDADGRAFFPGIRPREITSLPPVIEHVLTAWDRPDLLADHYYGAAERWWQILDANPAELCAESLTVCAQNAGQVILIPRDTNR